MIVYVQSQFYNSNNTALTINAGSTVGVLPVPANKHGMIHRFLIKQSSGTSTAFTANLTDIDTTQSGAPSIDLCRIIPAISVSAGGVGAYYSDGGVPYRNKSNDPYFYVIVSVGSPPAAALKFDLTLTWSAPES